MSYDVVEVTDVMRGVITVRVPRWEIASEAIRKWLEAYQPVRLESPETATDEDEAPRAVSPPEAAVAPATGDSSGVWHVTVDVSGLGLATPMSAEDCAFVIEAETKRPVIGYGEDEPGELERMRRVFATWDFRSGT